MICLSTDFLIKNGIITSDDEKIEIIKDDYNKKNYEGTDPYIKILYDLEKNSSENRKYKLYVITIDEIDNFNSKSCTKTDAEIFK